MINVKPAVGPNDRPLRVRMPDGSRYLQDDGEKVVLDNYWRRRISDGDVELQPATTKKGRRDAG